MIIYIISSQAAKSRNDSEKSRAPQESEQECKYVWKALELYLKASLKCFSITQMVSNITSSCLPQWPCHILATRGHPSLLSVLLQPYSPAVPAPGKGLQLVHSSSLTALSHFPLYFPSQGESPCDSPCFGNGLLSCHPPVRACLDYGDPLLAISLPRASPYSSLLHPARGIFFQKPGFMWLW